MISVVVDQKQTKNVLDGIEKLDRRPVASVFSLFFDFSWTPSARLHVPESER